VLRSQCRMMVLVHMLLGMTVVGEARLGCTALVGTALERMGLVPEGPALDGSSLAEGERRSLVREEAASFPCHSTSRLARAVAGHYRTEVAWKQAAVEDWSRGRCE
jgi:hypothetical protein